MTPERWKQIDELFQAVIEQPPSERSAFLDAACGDDNALRDEVDSLISLQEQAESFLEVPAFEASSALVCATAFTSMSGQVVGPYRIERPLGVGGMGEVYLAEHIKLEKKVAIKFLPPYLQTDETAKRRLLREAQAAAKLEHPGICAVYEVNDETDQSFIVMQYVDGETLAHRIKSRPLDLREALDITIQIAEALTEAHSLGIVHRDIKPGNVMITPRGQVKVLDFGLAKAVDTQSAARVSIDNQLMLSRPGDRPGTPPYMSPEQARGKPVDARGDLFAVGVILYECIAGTRPFVGNTTSEILDQIRVYNPPPPSNFSPGIPSTLDSIVLKALAKRSRARYQSAAELLEDLRGARSKLDFQNQVTIIPILSERETTRWLSAWTSVTNVIGKRRALVSVTALVLCLAIGIITVALVRQFRQPYHPAAAALQWYNTGTSHLRNGAYFEASKALQKAVSADDKFALAHARLAEALIELDYDDQAQKEIIRAESLARELPLQSVDSLYLRAITNTVLREFSTAIESYRQLASAASDQEKLNAYLDQGRAYENNDELENARKIYQEVSNSAPQWPTSFLRLGVVCGKLQDLTCAFEAFTKAEALYKGLKDQEGVIEVSYQRGFFLLDAGKLSDARMQLQDSVQMAQSAGNQYQLIRAMQALSSVLELEGKLAQAEQQATEAIRLALSNDIENQAVSGDIRLGDALLYRGDYDKAERHYQQALELAQRYKMRVNEAWARRQLGNLRSQQHRADDALTFLQPAAAFFQQGGYRKWYSQTLTLLGRSYRDNGDYEAALKVFRDLQELGKQLGDESQVAMSNIDIGTVLANKEQYSEALAYFDASYRIFKSLNSRIYLGYAANSRASMLLQLGRSDEAQAAIDEAILLAERPEGRYEPLLADIYTVNALLELSSGHLRESESKSRQALDLASTKYPDVIVLAKQILGLSRVRSGATRVGTRLCEQAVEFAKSTGDSKLLSGALLALAEAALDDGEAARALEAALQAQESFAHLGKPDSEWRAWLIAAEASERLHRQTAAREYGSYAVNRLSDLEKKWGTEVYRRYQQRSDITEFRKQLDHLLEL